MGERIQLSRKKGWRIPENTVSVARPGRWGNPFRVGDDASHFSIALPAEVTSVEQAVECFRYYADTWMHLTGGRWIAPLRGKNLACWCPLTDKHGNRVPCHADVLLEIANPTPEAREARA